ncbi:MAG: hypothetical protein H6734_19505 [Alphaproteobacteria bacterium]|nr:hypothetical protein [Alphaproteobacteria bacterium]
MFAVLLLGGCEKPVPLEPSFEVDVAPILERHCTRCHTSLGRLDGGVELDTYAGARSTRVSSVCTSLDGAVLVGVEADLRPGDPTVCGAFATASMPPGAVEHLTVRDQEVLARWATTGALP